jgi:hypothetical protein
VLRCGSASPSCGSGSFFHFDADPGPTFYFDTVPDPDPDPHRSNSNLRPPGLSTIHVSFVSVHGPPFLALTVLEFDFEADPDSAFHGL